MFRKFSHLFEFPNHKGDHKSVGSRACEHPGCLDEGIYRAPKSRYHLESGADDWFWFCLIHIRDYNAKWNYYANMSEDEIEKERRADVTWQRPTWPLGSHQGSEAAKGFQNKHKLKDPFGFFDDDVTSTPYHQEGFHAQSPEGKALLALGLSFPFTQAELRQQYLKLVKKHHPDINKNNAEDLEAIKGINEAYDILKKFV
jgi:hypothetical protein